MVVILSYFRENFQLELSVAWP